MSKGSCHLGERSNERLLPRYTGPLEKISRNELAIGSFGSVEFDRRFV